MSFTFRCVDPLSDAPLLHRWMTEPRASFWGMQSATVDEVAAEYSRIQSSGHHHSLLGLDGGEPAFLMEEYQPSRSPLAAAYAVVEGDIGMHLLVAPPSGKPTTGYTTAVMESVLRRLFQQPGVERVVVEPDERNARIHVLNERLGFLVAGRVTLPDKVARLSFCTRQDYLAATATLRDRALFQPEPQGAVL